MVGKIGLLYTTDLSLGNNCHFYRGNIIGNLLLFTASLKRGFFVLYLNRFLPYFRRKINTAMISENIIKTKFIIDELKLQTDIFYREQIGRFGKYLHSKSGETISSLSAPDYYITASGEQFQLVAYITKQLRFQDMGVRKLYTQPMHSTLAGRLKARLQYGLSEEIRENIINRLQQSLD